MKKTYAAAFDRETLEECLFTEKPISKIVFCKLIQSGLYHFYAFDDRINANRYLLNDIAHNYVLPTWLHDYVCEDFNK